MRMLIAATVMAALLGVVLAAGKGGGEPTEQDKMLAKLEVFPKDDEWNRDISKEAVDPKSDALIAEIGAGKSLHPDWGPDEIRQALTDTAVDLGDPGRDDAYGHGLVDAAAAVAY